MKGEIKIGLFYEGQRCPACSSERDHGGRMILHRGKKRSYLKCPRCKYVSSESKFEAEERRQKWYDKELFNQNV